MEGSRSDIPLINIVVLTLVTVLKAWMNLNSFQVSTSR